jgi:hypothetical protein
MLELGRVHGAPGKSVAKGPQRLSNVRQQAPPVLARHAAIVSVIAPLSSGDTNFPKWQYNDCGGSMFEMLVVLIGSGVIGVALAWWMGT